ncbi:MAG: CAP domain-containing protein [Acidobacteriota bacterium]
MKVRLIGLAALGCALVLMVGFSNSDLGHSQTQKTTNASGLPQAEKDLLTEINQARANPTVYATYLEKLKPLFNGREYRVAGRQVLMTEEGWAAVDEAIKFLRATKPLPPLAESNGLSLAAQVHIKDQSRSGSTGHTGSNSSMIEQRVKPFGNWQGAIGENLTYGNESARERILTWLIDDGFASRGHRKRLLSYDYKVAGLACGPHPQFVSMCCLTLAGGFTDLQTAKPKTTTPTTTTPASSPTNKSKTTSKGVQSRKM